MDNLMMKACLRSAGCPAAERNLLTGPTAGAPPAFLPQGRETPFAPPRCPREGGRAVLLRRRRLARDDFLGVKVKLHSLRAARIEGRPSIDVWCNPHAGLTPLEGKIRLQPLAERQAAAAGREKTGRIQSASAVRPIDFRDHIDVRPLTPVLGWAPRKSD